MTRQASQNWIIRFQRQFGILLYKNALVSVRNWRASALRLLAPLFFLLLLFLINLIIRASQTQDPQYETVLNPSATNVTPIPRCESDVFYTYGTKCLDFVYSLNTNDTRAMKLIRDVVQRVREENGFGQDRFQEYIIPPNKVQEFDTRDDVQLYLAQHLSMTGGAYHFDVQYDLNYVGYTLQNNYTSKPFRGSYQDPNFYLQLPMQSTLNREITRYFLKRDKGDDIQQYKVGFKQFPHPVLQQYSIISGTGGLFLFAASMFSFVIQLGNVVHEKETGIKQALRNVGMMESSYWMSTLVWEVVFIGVKSLLIVAFGAMFQFVLFLHNSFGLVFLQFFLFQIAMTALAFLISTFTHKSQSATYLGFLIFVLGWLFQSVVGSNGVPYSKSFYDQGYFGVAIFFDIFPWNPFQQGLNDLDTATANNGLGLRFGQRYSYCHNQCVYPLGNILLTFIIQFLVMFVLAIYFDNVLSNELGVRRAPWYFLQPSYWFPNLSQILFRRQKKKRSNKKTYRKGLRLRNPLNRQNSVKTLPTGEDGSVSKDVIEEETQLKSFIAGNNDRDLDFVEVCGLQKKFSSMGKKPFWAIKGSWFSIAQNQIFCLLGPNGAGKSTTINCLTGQIPTTGGDAIIYGYTIKSPGGMDKIRANMGVCPQFDVMWQELTGNEHLRIFGTIKGLSRQDVTQQSKDLLEKVRLTSAGNQVTITYSGGMRRRLSVALALLGDPKVLYLDEPTTGMDPIARRYVWDIIQNSKQGRAIILTTHSMEEADMLADKTAIMAKGRIRAIGSNLHLKQSFATGYLLAVSIQANREYGLQDEDNERVNNLKSYVYSKLQLKPIEENKAYLQYAIPQNTNQIFFSEFLNQLQNDKKQLGVIDVQLGMSSLEEVFLSIAKQAEIQAAQNRKNKQKGSGFELKDKSIIEIPIGYDYVKDNRTQLVYQVIWAQDDEGKLSISDLQAIESVHSMSEDVFQGQSKLKGLFKRQKQ